MYLLYQLMLFPVTLSDRNYPKPPYFKTFCIAFHFFVVSVVRDFKFGRLAVASASPRMANHPRKGRGYVT